MAINPIHRSMVRESLKREKPEQPRRKRKKTEVITVDSESSDELEDVDLDAPEQQEIASEPEQTSTAEPEGNDLDDMDDSGSDDFADLEDVDLDMLEDKEPETLTFNIANEPKKPEKKRSFVPIGKEERQQRKTVHKLVLFSMLCHGAVRNKWCLDPQVLRHLKRCVPAETAALFHQDDENVLDYVKARRVIDGLRKLVAVFSRKFKVSAPGLGRLNWGSTMSPSEPFSLPDFLKAVKSFRGSRDTAAQCFVALLRSIGVSARLVFSIQTPDYRSLRPVGEKTTQKEPKKPKSEFDPVFIPNPRQALLQSVRSGTQDTPKRQKPVPASNYPVFWIEVWNKYSQKWITVDPVLFKVVEVMPMRRKGKFEAPLSDETHQTWYVMAYGANGKIADVTRRYTQFYNAKTVKKRIGFASDEDQHWYERAIRAVSRNTDSVSLADAFEWKEFYDRHICEGTPNNIADFKNHPVYVLESQILQDEVIYPNDETSKCGTFRSMNKSTVIPIYKRSHVFKLKTPKAWHMRGRVLRVGAQPLKVKKSNVVTEDGDDDGQVRLYAEFQTELMKPAPIVNGQIVKNAFGNVEIFVPSMIPENGYLAECSRTVTIKILEKAARTMGIDFARAIVAFEFGGKGKSGNVTPKEGGILIEAQYKEALLAVVEGFVEQEEYDRKLAVELNALRAWDVFLKNLQIISRLDREHGEVNTLEEQEKINKVDFRAGSEAVSDGTPSDTPKAADTTQNVSDASPEAELASENESEAYYSVESEDDNPDDEVYVPRPTKRSRRSRSDSKLQDELEKESGGFMPENESGGFMPENEFDGGFLPAENTEEGGFLPAENTEFEGGFLPSGETHENPETINSDSESGGFLPDDAFAENEESQNDKEFRADSVAREEQDLDIEYSDLE